MMVLLFILFVIFAVILFEYSTIQLYNTIYFDKNGTEVVVIGKTLFTVTIAYMDDNPQTISIFEFMLNYNEK